MGTLTDERIAELLIPYLPERASSPGLAGQVSSYLDLLQRWNARVNLTSIRSPEEMVARHFGESLFTAARLRDRLGETPTIMDFGSGAGFPGLPIQMLLPKARVTVTESQARKVAFLREVVRTLGLSAEVWPRRVEEMPEGRQFDAVTMRAVDRMGLARAAAADRVRPGGWLAMLAGEEWLEADGVEVIALPGSERRWLILQRQLG